MIARLAEPVKRKTEGGGGERDRKSPEACFSEFAEDEISENPNPNIRIIRPIGLSVCLSVCLSTHPVMQKPGGAFCVPTGLVILSRPHTPPRRPSLTRRPGVVSVRREYSPIFSFRSQKVGIPPRKGRLMPRSTIRFLLHKPQDK